ncbi:MAG: DEAD/DEAH box helicase [Oscillospiraceae bacterium]
MELSLRDYQLNALEDTRAAFRAGYKKPLVCLPCGAGKTVCFAYMAASSQEKGKAVWFLVHRRELLQQTTETFERFGIPMNTIHIGMVQTVARHLDSLPSPDFVIFDEGHFAAANTWRKIADAYPEAFLCGLSATPVRLDGKPLRDVYDILVEGITTRQLIAAGWLAPYRYFAPAVADLSALKRKGADYDSEQAAEMLSTKTIFGDVIQHWREHADGLQTICYCSTVEHSKSMAEEFRAAGINAVHFDGETPDKERDDVVRRFRSREITILCNVDLISYGFDVPDCWCCILLRPTASTALFIQQACRALRPQENKVAVILDHVGNYERHGLPDDDREWSLDGGLAPRKEYGEDGRLKIRQCPMCYFTYPGELPACPNCGYKAVLCRTEIKNIKEIRLKEIKRVYRAEADVKVADKSAAECKTLTELQAYARRKGYKSGWAWRQARMRGLVKDESKRSCGA